MIQLPPEAVRDALRVVLELEHRCQQIDGAIVELKGAFSEPESLSVPDTIGLVAELRWHLTNSARQLAHLETALGVERKIPGQRRSRPAQRPQQDLLRGSTDSLSLPDLIGLLGAQQKSGTLWIKGEKETFILELLRGAIVHAMSDSPRPDERLGTVLVARNKLSTEKLEEFLRHYCPADGKIGELMARARLVSEDDLRDALGWQVRELFQRIFALERAVFWFREGEISKLELRVSLNTTRLLLEAAHTRDERGWMAAAPEGDALEPTTPGGEPAADPA